MITQHEILIHEAKVEDKQRIANLIHFETLVHRHLDWRPPLDWINHHPFLLATKEDRLLAALACPPDPPHIAWIRLFAASPEVNLENVWNLLWSAALFKLREDDNLTVAAIPLQEWFRNLIQISGFKLSNKVITLTWGQDILPERSIPGLSIRPMNLDDLSTIEMLDELAFGPIWHNSKKALEMAFHQSVIATVAESDEKVIGYLISTANSLGGHIARLAVHPQYQGRGIGYCILRDGLDQFKQRGARHVTVNTQDDNLVSLTLYQKFGFKRTDEEFPVYIHSLPSYNAPKKV